MKQDLQNPMFGKYTKAYLIITFLISFLAAAYIAKGIFFPGKQTVSKSHILLDQEKQRH
jgi:hypothetical protein